MKCAGGLEFLLDLPRASVLRGGDALVLQSGALIEVIAAPEPLAEISVDDPHALARIAYHLGNRHLPVQILPGKIRIRIDAIIEDMARGLGAKVAHIEAPFDPEGGAYAEAERHEADAHDHVISHPHSHA
jgi:urease accessory protein